MAKKTKKRSGPGRPPSNLNWVDVSARFLPAEKRRIEAATRKTKASGAQIIRAGAMRLVKGIEQGEPFTAPGV